MIDPNGTRFWHLAVSAPLAAMAGAAVATVADFISHAFWPGYVFDWNDIQKQLLEAAEAWAIVALVMLVIVVVVSVPIYLVARAYGKLDFVTVTAPGVLIPLTFIPSLIWGPDLSMPPSALVLLPIGLTFSTVTYIVLKLLAAPRRN